MVGISNEFFCGMVSLGFCPESIDFLSARVPSWIQLGSIISFMGWDACKHGVSGINLLKSGDTELLKPDPDVSLHGQPVFQLG